ncbi:unnamed protein product [Taenia asiatica]|uniref:Uncharacterized protein n=1 Tax=Taenia asiatica TaxID=60517 RepID=A0A3P6PPE3_TAEAS|nr:unnamed protein product [Taenia asiatica]
MQQTFLTLLPSLINALFFLLWSSGLLVSRSSAALLCISVFLAVRRVSSSPLCIKSFVHSLSRQADRYVTV